MDFELAKWIAKGIICVAFLIFCTKALAVVCRVIAYERWRRRNERRRT